MRFIWQHIQTILNSYKGELPLAHYLKSHFKQNPQLGSRDRRLISDLLYSWYRCTKGLPKQVTDLSLKTMMLSCLKYTGSTINEKLFEGTTTEAYPLDLEAIFPYDIPFSTGIERKDWLQSMLHQPDLFIRIRKNREKIVQILSDKQISYKFLGEQTLQLPNNSQVDKLLPTDAYVVQDASSQATGSYFSPRAGEQWYDCCSGAGGKSLLLSDLTNNIQLTVSDVRKSILNNLEARFNLYGLKVPETFVLDAAKQDDLKINLGARLFDAIICDVPCSGSGTWARTPEQCYFFNVGSLHSFPVLQKQIVVNVARHLKPGGKLIYITCSVFKAENEDVVEEVIASCNLELVAQKLINGIANNADNLFISVLMKRP